MMAMRIEFIKFGCLLLICPALAATAICETSQPGPLYKVAYSTFLGGSDLDEASAIAVDSQGNVFVAGSTRSTNFPITSNAIYKSLFPFASSFITKLDSAGKVVYSSYLNGWIKAIALDSAGNVYVAGHAYSDNFFTTPLAIQQNFKRRDNSKTGGAAFVMKLDSSTGAIIYSTLLGGSGGEDWILRMTVDREGNAFVAGYTNSPDFPITSNAFQRTYKGQTDSQHITCHAFVAKLNATGSALIFSTYLEGSNYEEARGIAIDSAGNSYITGYTKSPDFPTTPGVFQTKFVGVMKGFVTKLNNSGTNIVYSTFFGGFDDYHNGGDGIVVDHAGNAYVTGNTQSPSFPTTPSAFQTKFAGDYSNAFILKLNGQGTALEYSTLLGGKRDSVGDAIAIDGLGNVYVSGFTNSRKFPTTQDAYQREYGGGLKRLDLGDLFDFNEHPPMDVFVSVVSPGGDKLLYSTLLGGWADDLGYDIAIDVAGNIYVTGTVESAKFPTTKGAFQLQAGGGGDSFVAKLARTK